MTKPRLRPWMLLVGSAALCLLFGEVVVRWLLPPPGFMPFVVAETRGVVESDPGRGYRYASNLSRHIVVPDYEIDFSTNALGMRDVEIDSVPPDRPRWLAVGDSYTQGNGVQSGEAWPKRLQARVADLHVFNAGVSAYGLHQIRRTAEVLFPILRPELILVGLYGHGYSRLADPYVVVGDGAGLMRKSLSSHVAITPEGYLLPVFAREPLKTGGVWIDKHWHWMGHLLHLLLGPRTLGVRPMLPAELPAPGVLERDMQPMLDELARLDADARRWGVPLVGLLIEPVDEEGRFAPISRRYDEIVAGFARDHRICIVDPKQTLASSGLARALRLGGDPHWSPRAHDLAAGALVEALAGSASADTARGACAAAARVVRSRT
ncbi:MAG: SGNH/GDSL hydrolase family protein [Myxococcota bacterium]